MAFPAITSRKKQFTGTGLKGPFVFDKYLLSESELIVIKTSGGVDTTLVMNTDYTVTLIKKSNGVGYLSAEINLTDALEDDETLTVEAQLSYEQTLDLVNGTEFDLDAYEAQMDRSALMSSQLSAQLQTSLKTPNSSTITDTEIKSLGSGKYLRVNSTATLLETVNAVDLTLGGSFTPSSNNFLVGTGSAWQVTTPANTRTALGLGSMSIQASNSVTITGGSITGITDLTVSDGGTGASDASTARDNLGLTIGTNVQAYSADLAALATYNTNGLLVRTGSGSYIGRTLVASTGFTMTNDNGVSGNPTLSYNISGLSAETSPLVTDSILIQRSSTPLKTTLSDIITAFGIESTPPAFSLITSQNASSVSTVNFTNSLSGYKAFVLIGTDIAPSSGTLIIQLRPSIDGGSNYLTSIWSGSRWNTVTTNTSISVTNNTNANMVIYQISGTTAIKGSFIVTFYNPSSSNGVSAVDWEMVTLSDTSTSHYYGSGIFNLASAMNAFQLFSGQTFSGRVTLYGIL